MGVDHYKWVHLCIVILLIGSATTDFSVIEKCSATCGLYPRPSETRQVQTLDGLWNFYKSPQDDLLKGFRKEFFKNGLELLPGVQQISVPSFYNTGTTDESLNNYTGVVWYERKFFISKDWLKNRKVWIRFGGISSLTHVWVNGQNLDLKHDSSHLPFDKEIPYNILQYGKENRITISIDSRVVDVMSSEEELEELDEVISPESYKASDTLPDHRITFSGIQQSVVLFTTPGISYIRNIHIDTEVANGTACMVSYRILTDGTYRPDQHCARVSLFGANDVMVVSSTVSGITLEGTLNLDSCKLWWPAKMLPLHDHPGYRYTLEVQLHHTHCDNEVVDVYRQKIGIRKITWTNKTLMINRKGIYLMGLKDNEPGIATPFNMFAAMRDLNLVSWINANSLKMQTPPTEEFLELADKYGILLIVQPSWGKHSRHCHKETLQELICLARNHPSVIAWSVTLDVNESKSRESAEFYQNLTDYGKSLDSSRPFAADVHSLADDGSADVFKSLDLLFLEHMSMAAFSFADYTSLMIGKVAAFEKPVVINSYGNPFLKHSKIARIADNPFQSIINYQKVFDTLRRETTLVGECFGNFVDIVRFAETYAYIEDGVFNRNREPKQLAFQVRQRYKNLGHQNQSSIVI